MMGVTKNMFLLTTTRRHLYENSYSAHFSDREIDQYWINSIALNVTDDDTCKAGPDQITNGSDLGSR